MHTLADSRPHPDPPFPCARYTAGMRQWRLALFALGLACNALPAVSVDDGGVSAPDAGPPASASDAGPAEDSGDAHAPRDGAEVGAPTWCDTRVPAPVFCDDFDRGELGARWDFFLKSPPGTAALDFTDARSSPNALTIVTGKIADAEFGSILLRKTVGGSPIRARLGFDVRVDATQTSGTLAIATLDLATDHLLTLYLRDDNPGSPGPALVEVPPGGAPPVRNALPVVPAVGQWTRVELDVDAAAGKATVRFDGKTILDGVALAAGATTKPTVRVGVLCSGPADPYAFRFDNVALDVTP